MMIFDAVDEYLGSRDMFAPYTQNIFVAKLVSFSSAFTSTMRRPRVARHPRWPIGTSVLQCSTVTASVSANLSRWTPRTSMFRQRILKNWAFHAQSSSGINGNILTATSGFHLTDQKPPDSPQNTGVCRSAVRTRRRLPTMASNASSKRTIHLLHAMVAAEAAHTWSSNGVQLQMTSIFVGLPLWNSLPWDGTTLDLLHSTQTQIVSTV